MHMRASIRCFASSDIGPIDVIWHPYVVPEISRTPFRAHCRIVLTTAGRFYLRMANALQNLSATRDDIVSWGARQDEQGPSPILLSLKPDDLVGAGRDAK